MDPRTWDLNQLLAAFEATMRQSAKDEASWRRTQQSMMAEPKHVRDERKRAAATGQASNRMGMSVTDAEALLASFAASDAQYG